MPDISLATLEVVRSALLATAEEMSVTIRRTSRSITVRELRDHSTALFDEFGQNIAQSERVPVHLNSMGPCLAKVLANYIPAMQWGVGDVVIVNDPYCGGSHLPDIMMFSPAFFNGVLLGFAGCLSHHTDVGGGVAGSSSMMSTEVYAEGIRIPPVKWVEGGILNQALQSVLLQNGRQPDIMLSDLNAQHSATQIGVRNMEALARRHTADGLRAMFVTILDQSEASFRTAIGKLPAVTVSFEDVVDGDGLSERPIKIACVLTIASDRITVDLSGSDDQCAGPINCTPEIAASCVYYAVIAALAEDSLINAGCYRLIDIVTRPGSVTGCLYPAPVSGRIVSGHRIANVVMGALSKVLPLRIPAAYYGVSYSYFLSVRDDNGKRRVYGDTEVGGWGASYEVDGSSAFSAGLHNPASLPVEVLEAAFPVRFHRYAIRPDSFGGGQFQGGAGLIREWELLAAEGIITVNIDRAVSEPYGLYGGGNGSRSSVEVHHADGSALNFPPKISGLRLSKGDRFAIKTSGGGGYGVPEKRSLDAIRHDIQYGYLSEEKASALYPQYDSSRR